jgi:hypothetical protein
MRQASLCTGFLVVRRSIEPRQMGAVYEIDLHCMLVWNIFKKLRHVTGLDDVKVRIIVMKS